MNGSDVSVPPSVGVAVAAAAAVVQGGGTPVSVLRRRGHSTPQLNADEHSDIGRVRAGSSVVSAAAYQCTHRVRLRNKQNADIERVRVHVWHRPRHGHRAPPWIHPAQWG